MISRHRVQRHATAQCPRELRRSIAIRDVADDVKFPSDHGMRSESEEERDGRECEREKYSGENSSRGEYSFESSPGRTGRGYRAQVVSRRHAPPHRVLALDLWFSRMSTHARQTVAETVTDALVARARPRNAPRRGMRPTPTTPRHLKRRVKESTVRCGVALAVFCLVELLQTRTAAQVHAKISSWRRVPSKRPTPIAVSSSDANPCIPRRSRAQRHADARARLDGEHESAVRFATFAFTQNAGDRWGVDATRRALKLMYSSLVRAHAITPTLHVYTDVPDVVPLETTMGTRTDIVSRVCDATSLPKNVYTRNGGKATKNSKWASLSRAKLDVVEDLMLHGVGPVVWIDLDTLVFVDLARAFQRGASTWLVGYQRGMQCTGLKSCVGSHFRSVRPEFDVLGDLWSLDLAAIEKVRDYERRWVSSRWVRKPPKYDLQAYFSLMLENGVLAENVLLHNILPDLNFGFTCSNFEHPTSTNMEISVDSDDAQRLRCPIPKGVKMSPRVGTLSFTAWSFQKMFLDEEKPTFDSLSDDQDVRAWFARWFYSPL